MLLVRVYIQLKTSFESELTRAHSSVKGWKQLFRTLPQTTIANHLSRKRTTTLPALGFSQGHIQRLI